MTGLTLWLSCSGRSTIALMIVAGLTGGFLGDSRC